MAKKTEPIITYKEILCLAHYQLDARLEEYRQKAAKFPEDHPTTEMIREVMTPLQQKQEVIEQLYEIECGVAWN